MSQLIFLITFLLIQKCFSLNVCIWNAPDLNSFTNGLYEYNGESIRDYPSYKLDIDLSCNVATELYLFYSTFSHWTISKGLDDVSPANIIANCYSDTAELPDECIEQWQIPINTSQPNITSNMVEKCPHINCDGLHIHYEIVLDHEPCNGAFQNKYGLNIYQQGSNDLFFFFNPKLFRWVCGTVDTINKCYDLDEYDGYAIQQKWFDATNILNKNGKSMNMTWSNGHIATVTCDINQSYAYRTSLLYFITLFVVHSY
eukprot:359393_1